MNVRLKKEFNGLFWPWLVTVLIGFLPLAVWWVTPIIFRSPSASYDLLQWRQNAYFIANSTYALGVAILVALPFGSELQERTLTLLLSQPYPRWHIWREKILVILFAVLSLTLAHATGYLPNPAALLPNLKFASILLLIVICSGIFWSVTSRSVVGGIVLSLFSLIGLYLLVNALTDQYIYVQGLSYHHSRDYLFLFLLSLVIALIFLRQAWRKFSRLEPVDNWENESGMSFSHNRNESRKLFILSQADSPLFNLVLKELRLLKPAIQLMLLFIGLWVTASLFPNQSGLLKSVARIYLPLFIVLAGCVSLSREKGLGIHAANLTSPVSPLTQWLIKNCLACLVGLTGSIVLFVVLPLATGLHDEVAGMKVLAYPWFAVITAGILILALIQISFTSATITNRLLHALFLTVVIVTISVVVFAGGFLVGHHLELPVQKLAYSLVAHNQLTVWGAQQWLLFASVWVWAFSCLSITYAGWKCFRHVQSEFLNLWQTLKFLVIGTLSLGILHGSLHKSLDRDIFLNSSLYQETKAAFLNLNADIPYSEIYHEQAVSFDDVLSTGNLSPQTQIWLRDCTFKIVSAMDTSSGVNKPVIRVEIQFPIRGRAESISLRPRIVKKSQPAPQVQ